MTGEGHDQVDEAADPDGEAVLDDRLDDARDVIDKLLEAIGVERVVLVDDQAGPQMEVVRAALSAGASIDVPRSDDPPSDPSPAAITEWLMPLWEELGMPERRRVFQQALAAVATEPGHESGRPELPPLEVLSHLVGDRLAMVTPDEWENEADELIGDDGERTLVLFDLVLQLEPEGGMQLLKELRARRDDVRSAILTSSAEPDAELRRQAELADGHKVPADRLLLSSKSHLTAAGCMRFADLLRVTANGPRLHALRDHVLGLADSALQEARTRLTGYDDRVLEDVVFRSSHREGAWEVDALLRVLNVLQRDEMRTAQTTDQDTGRLVRDARELVLLQYEPHGPSEPQAAELMSLEDYDPAAAINPIGLPLANGDLFRIGTRHYILLEQPCYLQVRRDGKRSRETACLTLLEIGSRPRDAADKPTTERPCWELRVGHGLGDVREIFLTPRHSFPAAILDLCTLNADGRAHYRPSGPIDVEPLTAGLRKLGDRRVKHFERLGRHLGEALEALKPNTRRDVADRMVAQHLGEHLVKPAWRPDDEATIAYACERVGRLAPRQADAALTELHVHEARAAHDHDLGRFI